MNVECGIVAFYMISAHSQRLPHIIKIEPYCYPPQKGDHWKGFYPSSKKNIIFKRC